jgi:hypothetical protein
MLSSINSISSPISALARLLYTNMSFLDVDGLISKGIAGVRSDDLEFLIEQALDRQHSNMFVGTLEKFRRYMDEIYYSIPKLAGKDIILLGAANKGLYSEIGFLKHVNTDDFCTKTDVAPAIVDIYDQYADKVKKGIRENAVFWRIAPFDMPFLIRDSKKETYIINPFHDRVQSVNSNMQDKDKTGLGDFKRYKSDGQREESYSISEVIFSIKKFHKAFPEHNYLEALYDDYSSTYAETIYGNISIEYFQKLCESAIRINREILKRKYENIFGRLDIDKVYGYFIAGDVANDILSLIEKDGAYEKSIIGEKLLQDTKYMPLLDVLEPQALNRLSGWFNAKYGDETTSPVIVQKRVPQERHELHRSLKHPYIYTGMPAENLDELLEDVPTDQLAALEKDVAKYQFRISPIEVHLYFLNVNNYRVYTDKEFGAVDKTWSNIRGGSKVQPLLIRDVERQETKYIRPSNQSQKCEYSKYLSVRGTSDLDIVIESNDYAKAGTLLHKISNTLDAGQQRFLGDVGLMQMERLSYSEVPIAFEFKPTEKDFINASMHLEKRFANTHNPLYSDALDRLSMLDNTNLTILDNGSPDGVAIIEDSRIPVIIDFKRRIGRYFPVHSFFEQTVRYAFAVIQSKKLETDRFYSVIIQTPYSSIKYGTRTDFFDKGNYRHQKIVVQEIMLNSAFTDKVRVDMLSEYVTNKIFFGDPRLGLLARELYKHEHCDNCFQNKNNDYRCRYILEGAKKIWDKSPLLLSSGGQ